jgi:hypothetical protein
LKTKRQVTAQEIGKSERYSFYPLCIWHNQHPNNQGAQNETF